MLTVNVVNHAAVEIEADKGRAFITAQVIQQMEHRESELALPNLIVPD